MARSTVIDIARGISILLVVLGHSWWMQEHQYASRLLSSFRMPLFFFMAGLFLRPGRSLLQFLGDKADATLKPYLVVMTAVIACHWLMGTPDAARMVAGMVYGSGVWLPPHWGPMWFLPHLFMASTCAHLCVVAIGHWSIQPSTVFASMLIALCFGAMYVLPVFASDVVEVSTQSPVTQRGMPFGVDLVLVTSTFIVAGHLLAGRVARLGFQPWLFAAAAAAFLLLHKSSPTSIALFYRLYEEPVVATMKVACGIYMTLSVAALLDRLPAARAFLGAAGRNSLFILMFHMLVQNKLAAWLLAAVPQTRGMRLAAMLLAMALAVLIPMALQMLVARRPRLAALLLPLPKHRRPWARPAPATADGQAGLQLQ